MPHKILNQKDTTKSSVIYQKPQLLTTFSLDADGRYKSSDIVLDSDCRIFQPIDQPTVHNLTYGFHALKPGGESSGPLHTPKLVDDADNLDNLLYSLVSVMEKKGREIAPPNVITWRGIMTKILAATYLKDPLSLQAIWFNVFSYNR
jgi:hypothetical protein